MLTKKSIIKKTITVGSSTLLSRVFGIIREMLMIRYLGSSALSDAFLTAFKIPNSLRKIFAEGALSAAYIPTIVQAMRIEGKRAVNALTALGFLIFEGIVLFLCALVMWQSERVIWLIAPGFSVEQVHTAAPYLQIMMLFIFFLSSSALLAGALQAVGHFFIPAFAQVLINIVWISALIICLYFSLPVTYLCWFILFAGFVQLCVHIAAYLYFEFGFGGIKRHDITRFAHVLYKFVLCLPSVSIMEITLFISTSFASYLPAGSMSLLYYANRFIGIPLGIFPVAFSTILLPHLSRINGYAPKRLSFYVLEATKLVIWITIPVALLMGFFAEKIFVTLFLSQKFTIMQAQQAAYILIVFTSGLFFFSLNKILLSVYYALHNTVVPALVSGLVALISVGLDFLLIQQWQAVGLALATTLSIGILQTILLLGILKVWFKFNLYIPALIAFGAQFMLHLVVAFSVFLLLYAGFYQVINLWLSPFFITGIGFWFWVGPLSGVFFLMLWYLKRRTRLTLYFLDE